MQSIRWRRWDVHCLLYNTAGGDTCRAYRARRALLTSGKPSVSGVIPHFSKLTLFSILFQVKLLTALNNLSICCAYTDRIAPMDPTVEIASSFIEGAPPGEVRIALRGSDQPRSTTILTIRSSAMSLPVCLRLVQLPRSSNRP